MGGGATSFSFRRRCGRQGERCWTPRFARGKRSGACPARSFGRLGTCGRGSGGWRRWHL